MRALIVGAAAREGAAGLVAERAAEADIVVAADGGAALCARAGVVPTVIVGDMDSLADDVRDDLARKGAAVRSYPADKDVTDLDLALAEASLRGATEVDVTAAFGLRLDHTLAAIGSLARRADLHPRLIEPDETGWVLSPDGACELVLPEPGTIFSILSLGEPATVSVGAVRWPLDGATLAPLSSWAISNVTLSPDARIMVSAGTAVVLVPGPDLLDARKR